MDGERMEKERKRRGGMELRRAQNSVLERLVHGPPTPRMDARIKFFRRRYWVDAYQSIFLVIVERKGQLGIIYDEIRI